MSRIILRECGIYALPDKREFVVRGSGRAGYTFYSHQAWNGSCSSEYRLNTEGHLLSKGFLLDGALTISPTPDVPLKSLTL